MRALLTPFTAMARSYSTALIAAESIFALVAWSVASDGLIPGPATVLSRMMVLLGSTAFMDNLLASTWLTAKGMGISIGIALVLAYLSVVPLFRPVAQLAVQARYLTLTGLIFLFTLLTHGGGNLKLSLLVFGIVPFFVTSLLSVIRTIPQEEYDLCTTLRMGRWRTLLEVIIVGRADAVLDVVRQNFAIAWMMITMVEGISMSEGGLGTLMIKSSKYIDLSTVFAILAVVLLLGIAFDRLLSAGRRWLFPYAR
jgi:NitT/TauT family transport system permease protein